MVEAFLTLRASQPVAVPHRRLRVCNDDGVDLLLGVFEPPRTEAAQDLLLFFHGAGGHMGAGYLDLGRAVHARCGAVVLLPDLRGHGRSGGERGRLGHLERMWRDVDTMLLHAIERWPQARLHLGGHSLGASLCLNWMTRGDDPLRVALRRRVQSLLLLAPYTGRAEVERPLSPGQPPFITRSGDGAETRVCFGYGERIAAQAGLVTRYDGTLFGSLAPQDFAAQWRQVLQRVRVTVLLAEDDELFSRPALHACLQSLRPAGASAPSFPLRIEHVPGGHLSGLYFAADALALALNPPPSGADPMTATSAARTLPPSLIESASLLPTGALPAGDRRFWAHSLTDLAAGFLRDGDCSRIAEAGGRALSMQDVQDAVERLRRAGVVAGDVVLVEVHNDVTAVASLLACWLSACCVCPVDPDTPVAVKALIAQESGAVATAGADGSVQPLSRALPPPRGLIRLRRPARVTGSDLAMIIFTSGSSGQPKGVMLSHHNVMSALRSISSYLRLREDDRILSIPPLFFDYGLYQLLLALFDGCALALNGRQTSTVMLLKQIEQAAPSVLPVVPALASALARLFAAMGKTAPAVRLITNTGGHLSDSSIAALTQAFPAARIVPMYGLTECKRALFLDRERHPGRSGCVGAPMPGLDAAVLLPDPSPDGHNSHIAHNDLLTHDAHAGLRRAAPGEVGELHVRGPSVMQGYHRAATDGGARLLPGRYRDDQWLATGDLFSADDDGLLYFRGRSKELIKQGGYCLCPRDIEALAESVDEVASARVVARQEDNGDESAVLFAQVAPGLTRPRQRQLLEQIKQAVPRTLMPREVRFVEDWPATPNGKIDAKALVRWAAQPKASAR